MAGGFPRFTPPSWFADVALAAGLTAAVATAITFAPEQGGPPSAVDLALAPAVGFLALFRNRWPLGALVTSAACLQIYNLADNPGIFAAIPLSVALATAWATGHRISTLGIVLWFSLTPVVFALGVDLPDEIRSRVLNGAISDISLMAALLLLGEAVRSRRALSREHSLLVRERERSEALLLNVLPPSIADRLRQEEKVIADYSPDVTVMFADLVDFTRTSDSIDPEVLIRMLNDLFSAFDRLAERHGLEKIKTIGDAYMVAGGLPQPQPDHAEAIAEMALDLRDEVSKGVDTAGHPLAARIGIDTGPVVAGVIGEHKFSYDLWGDTVNTASRMESHGVPGRIQVTERTFRRLQGKFRFDHRGAVDVKGKGRMDTWFLLGRIAVDRPPTPTAGDQPRRNPGWRSERTP